ncbi:XRE family transcriptional regulator [Shewanella mesophila]|uniref:XRE family transcriptional regulator n=1 Tax=Shewanella mesophila TaxID=2864208 RepID=UPI001C65DDE4|nr:XRE family transcriptional regulator [Shewanella mesophila]QYJ86030.1 XRE family transcriptional regulator [Shewanella mesophila]
MALEFKDSLSLWIETKGISRKELIALLQNKYYEEFKGLDAITLSRWLNGKSTPPLYKQFYIAKCLGICLKEHIRSLDLSKIKYPTKYDATLYNLTKALDFSLSVLSYRYVPKYVKSEISRDSYQEHVERFGEFYGNVSPLKNFKSALYEMKSSIDYNSIVLKNENDEILGHWSGIVDIEKLNDIPSFINIPQNEVDRSCLVSLGYYVNSEHYFELIVQAICLYLMDYCKVKDFIYFFNIDCRPIIEFCKFIFNAEEMKYYPPLDDKDKMGVYLLKFNIIKSIANPILLNKIQNKLNCLEMCDPNECKKCNLKEIELRVSNTHKISIE